jgi:hypothetical protein
MVVLPILLTVRETVMLVRRSRRDQATDLGAGATPSEGAQKSSDPLRRYANSPRHEDPYTPGHEGPRSATAVISRLDVVLSSLQENGMTFKLPFKTNAAPHSTTQERQQS